MISSQSPGSRLGLSCVPMSLVFPSYRKRLVRQPLFAVLLALGQ